MNKNIRTLRSITSVLVLVLAGLLFFRVFDTAYLISFNVLAISALFIVLTYEAVILQNTVQAKRLLIIGLFLFILGLILLISAIR